MKYQVADLNNGPFGDLFDTPEAAEAERQRCIEEGIEADMRAGEIAREEVRVNAEEFFFVVEVESEVEQAERARDAARRLYLAELERDANRSDCSGAQEGRREARKEWLREEVERCEKELAEARQAAQGSAYHDQQGE